LVRSVTHYRSGQAFRATGTEAVVISRQSAHEGGNSPAHRPPLTLLEIFLVRISFRG